MREFLKINQPRVIAKRERLKQSFQILGKTSK